MMKILERFSLKGKNALIYAPDCVYGIDIAKGLIEAGAKVWLCGEDSVFLQNIAEKCSAQGVFEYHAGTKAEADRLSEFITTVMGKIDIFVESGSQNQLSGWLQSYENIVNNFAVTQRGLILTVQAVGEIMTQQKNGSIIFITDYAALVGCDVHNYDGCPEETKKDFSATYGFIKGSYVNYARQAAGFLGEAGCRCNAIAFSPKENTKPTAFEQAYIKHSHIRRMLKTEDIQNAVIFLASDASKYITGATIPVDGGYTAK